jgi:hypothetical protein
MSNKEETAKLKIKKPSLTRENDETFKVKLIDKKEEDAIPIGGTKELSSVGEAGSVRSTESTHSEEGENKEPENIESPIKEITEEETVDLNNHIVEEDYPITNELPEKVDKLVNFMKETGGNIEDYVRLNADYTTVSDAVLLQEYYAKTKPHLNTDERTFLLEDKFAWSDLAEEREIKQKSLAMKEEVAKARGFLEDLKTKYYDEIKLRPNINQDQQKAMDFFNRYNKEQKIANQQHDDFVQQTNKYLNEDFEGFDFNVSGRKYKYDVKSPSKVGENQSNLNTFIGKFLDNKGSVSDYKGYHKAIYAAQNVDTIAEHFYEQGKADAIKDLTAKSNNFNPEVRSTPTGELMLNGWKVKAISGVDSSKLKIKNKNKT